METGKWQKKILAELARRPAFYIKSILRARYSRAEQVALLRAMRCLEDRGLINVHREDMCYFKAEGKTVVYRPGYEVDWQRFHQEQTGNC